MSDSAPQQSGVRDDPERSRLVIERDGAVAYLVYRTEPGRLILVHTEVPEALGGHGVGGELVAAAIARARAGGLTVVPWCPFARRLLREHPDLAGGVPIDWTTPPPEHEEPAGG